MLMQPQQSSVRPYAGSRTEQRPPQSRPAPAAIDLIGLMKLTGAPVAFSRNEVIYSENRPADYVYKVISGSVRLCKVLSDGRRRIEAFYLPGRIRSRDGQRASLFGRGHRRIDDPCRKAQRADVARQRRRGRRVPALDVYRA